MTAILVTHDQTEANALADRIAVMEGGVLQQYRHAARAQGAPGQPVRRHLHRRAADERVRRYGRKMSQWTRTLADRRRRQLGLRLCGSGRSPSCARGCCRRAGRSCSASGRMRSAGPTAADGARSWPTSGSAIRRHIAAAIAGQTLVIGRRMNASTRAAGAARLPFDVAGTDLHIFDADTGAHIVAWRQCRHDARHSHRHRCRHLGDQVRGLTTTGEQIAVAACRTATTTLAGGGVEQDLARTWTDTAATLRELCRAASRTSPVA